MQISTCFLLFTYLGCGGNSPRTSEITEPNAYSDVKPLLPSPRVAPFKSKIFPKAQSVASIPTNLRESIETDDEVRPAELSAGQNRALDSITKQVLRNELFQRRNLPDIGLLPKRGPLYLLSGGPRAAVSDRSFPRAGRRRLQRMSIADLQRIADKENRTISYIAVEIEFEGSTALVSSGVDIVLPSASNRIALCCCSRLTDWKKVAGRWSRVRNSQSMETCS